jgi:hypothetical protein
MVLWNLKVLRGTLRRPDHTLAIPTCPRGRAYEVALAVQMARLERALASRLNVNFKARCSSSTESTGVAIPNNKR